MQLRYFRPSRGLQNLVSFHYIFETDTPRFSDLLTALLGQVQFRLFGDLQYRDTAAGLVDAPAVCLCGPLNRTLTLDCDGRMMLVGAGLLPAGWSLLVRASAAEIADQVIDGRALWGAAVDAAHGRIAEARSDAERIAGLDAFLCAQLAHGRARLDPRLAAVDRWIAGVPHARIDALVASLDVSARQAERIVAASHGASPKLLAAKYRTLRASAMLATGHARDWRDAGGGAFADQAHFIRDFRRFIGQPPTRFTGDAARLPRLLMRAKWAAGARSPLALWS